MRKYGSYRKQQQEVSLRRCGRLKHPNAFSSIDEFIAYSDAQPDKYEVTVRGARHEQLVHHIIVDGQDAANDVQERLCAKYL